MDLKILVVTLAVTLCAACAPEAEQQVDTPVGVAETQHEATMEEAESIGPAPELADSAWRLVNISSMDDTVDIPDDPSRFTLEFSADGSVAILADCNRGMGNWTSESAGRLQFGPIASTRALCPPESLSEKYLAQFEWVRSYILENGHLFLATMADGSIIEFEPITEPVAAIVLGEEIRTSDASEIQQAVFTAIFEEYAATNGITATDEEIQAWANKRQAMMEADGMESPDEASLTPAEQEEIAQLRHDMASAMIRQWKINKALYSEYGGRVIYQQFGPEPLDAYRTYLQQREADGAFSINDAAMEEEFWRYFTDESKNDFMEASDEAEAFATPPWEKEQ